MPLAPDEDFGPEPECAHLQTEMRLRINSGGGKMIYMQCLACGSAHPATAIKHSTITVAQLHALPAFDESLRESYQAKRREAQQTVWVLTTEERRKKYREYLQSAAWRVKRDLVMAREHFKCQGCHTASATQVHHLTYEHVFDELLFELAAVCEDCHRRCHREWGALK